MIRTAILSFWHVHARGYANQANAHPGIDLVAAWDNDSTRGRERATELGLDFVEDLDELLARNDIDAVIVQTATNLHHEVILKAIAAGKHVISDKVLAPTIKQANELIAAADAAHLVLVTGTPHLYHDYTTRLKEIVDSGDLGTLVNARMMNCHGQALEGTLPAGFFSKEEAGGGALIDMCHIVYLTPHFFGGLPSTAFASFGYFSDREVEDSAVVVVDYGNGAHVSLEASFVTKGAPRFEIELNGTEGSALFRSDSHPSGAGAPKDHVLVARLKGELEFTTIELGEPGPTPITQWAQHIVEGTRPDYNIERSLDLSRIVEASYLSAERHQPVSLSSLQE